MKQAVKFIFMGIPTIIIYGLGKVIIYLGKTLTDMAEYIDYMYHKGSNHDV